MEAGMIQCMYCTYTPNLNFILYNVEHKFLKPTHAPNHQPTHTTSHTDTHLEIWLTNFEECDKKNSIRQLTSIVTALLNTTQHWCFDSQSNARL